MSKDQRQCNVRALPAERTRLAEPTAQTRCPSTVARNPQITYPHPAQSPPTAGMRRAKNRSARRPPATPSSAAAGRKQARTPPLLRPPAAVVGTRHSLAWCSAPAPLRAARSSHALPRGSASGYCGPPPSPPRIVRAVGSGAVGPPRVALRQLGRQLTPPELPAQTLRHPDHSPPALRRPAAYAGLLPRARLAAAYSSSGPQDKLRSLALTRAPVRAVTPWRPRHSVYGAATAAAYVLLARSAALRRSAWGAGCG